MRVGRDRREEKTGFQERSDYLPEIDLQTDFVMVYGIDETMPARIEKWRQQGYVVHLMTGIAWGEYQDYLNGLHDGRRHWDEAQRNARGEMILHGEDVPYMVPTLSFTSYLIDRLKVAVGTGVEAIHLEEPEFWVDGGYSPAFQREWEIYYKRPWQPPHTSPDAQYRASKLKAYLYARCLDRVCSSLKEYAKVNFGRNLRCYVPTHSLLNYTQWRIVSPESQLLDLPGVDGYIAQVWTGTARTPNIYEGVRKERTFETAYLEYGAMQELVQETGRKMWFLHDPIEDNPNHTWSDYQENYRRTVVASVLHPSIASYEVAPWPQRIFCRKYPAENGTGKEHIPDSYATTLLTVMNALADLEVGGEDRMDPGVGILVSDSCLYQRAVFPAPVGKEEQQRAHEALVTWPAFYGLSLPLLKYGLPVRPVQLDNTIRFGSYLDGSQLLILSYEFMKPSSPGNHYVLAEWVRSGGALIYVGDESDPYHAVQEWWNQGKRKYASPAEHLFDTLGVGISPPSGLHKLGKGFFAFLPVHPQRCAREKGKADLLRETVRDIFQTCGWQWQPRNYLLTRRGPYVAAAVMEESLSEQPLKLCGLYADLFDPGLEVKKEVALKPGQVGFFADLNLIKREAKAGSCSARPVAVGSRLLNLKAGSGGFEFTARGPRGVRAAARFYCSHKPAGVIASCQEQSLPVQMEWEPVSETVYITYPNHPDGVEVKVAY